MAGFLDRLIGSGAFGRLNAADPLFGGLIPRREVMVDDMAQPISRGMVGRGSMSPNQSMSPQPRELNDPRIVFPEVGGPDKPQMNTRIDYQGMQLDLERQRNDLAARKFGAEHDLNERKFGADFSLDRSKFGLEQDKFSIDMRKQALEEWKVNNPEGSIETTQDGKIMVIDKRTGKSIDTGLKSNDLSEEDKLKIQHDYSMEQIGERNKGTLEAAKARNNMRNINPSQQRTAEDDALSELLREPKYSWLAEEGVITRDKSGAVQIKRPKFTGGMFSADKKQVEDAEKVISDFENEWKSRSSERMNKTFSSSGNGMVKGIAPDGREFDLRPDQIEAFKLKGGRVASEAGGVPNVSTSEEFRAAPQSTGIHNKLEVDDSVELLYNDAGKVVGARNRKK